MRQIKTTWNGPKSQMRAFVDSVKRTEAEKERKRKMARWFGKEKNRGID